MFINLQVEMFCNYRAKKMAILSSTNYKPPNFQKFCLDGANVNRRTIRIDKLYQLEKDLSSGISIPGE